MKKYAKKPMSAFTPQQISPIHQDQVKGGDDGDFIGADDIVEG